MMSAQHTMSADSSFAIRETRRLCFGGSFDPIHLGHLITARFAAEALGLPGVRLIPAAANPHKANGPIASSKDRLAICRLAVADDPFFVVDPIELNRPPPSFAIDTVTAIAGETGIRIPWLIGSDLLVRLPTWHRFGELLERVDFVVMRRAGHPIDVEGLDPRVATLAADAIEVPQLNISATAVRGRLLRGESVDDDVAPAVATYISQHRLYSLG